jgi:hypothetical protein
MFNLFFCYLKRMLTSQDNSRSCLCLRARRVNFSRVNVTCLRKKATSIARPRICPKCVKYVFLFSYNQLGPKKCAPLFLSLRYHIRLYRAAFRIRYHHVLCSRIAAHIQQSPLAQYMYSIVSSSLCGTFNSTASHQILLKMCTASSSSSRRILRSSLQQQSHAEPDEELEFLGHYSDDNVCDQNRQALYHDSSEVEETVVRPMTPFELARYRHDQLRRRARTTLVCIQ